MKYLGPNFAASAVPYIYVYIYMTPGGRVATQYLGLQVVDPLLVLWSCRICSDLPPYFVDPPIHHPGISVKLIQTN